MSFDVCIPIPKTEVIRTNWDHVRSHFEVDHLYVLGDGKTQSPDDLPSKTLISIEAGGNILLEEFEHPDDCIYLFGPDDYPLPYEMAGTRSPDYRVRIPTYTQREIFSFVAFAVVAWDRWMKRQ